LFLSSSGWFSIKLETCWYSSSLWSLSSSGNFQDFHSQHDFSKDSERDWLVMSLFYTILSTDVLMTDIKTRLRMRTVGRSERTALSGIIPRYWR
jgi:hypothetical protein